MAEMRSSFRPPSPSPSPLSGEEMEELELPPLPGSNDDDDLLKPGKGQDADESMTVEQMRHLADVESSFRVETHGGAVPLPESDDEHGWGEIEHGDYDDHDDDYQGDDEKRNNAHYDDGNEAKEDPKAHKKNEARPEEIRLPPPDEDEVHYGLENGGESENEAELPPPPRPELMVSGTKQVSSSQKMRNQEQHYDDHDNSSQYSGHSGLEDPTELETSQLPYHDEDDLDEYPPVPSSPEPEDEFPPVPSSPELEEEYPPVPSSPELEEEYPPVPSSPELEEEFPPVPSSPELAEEYPPVPSSPELEEEYPPVPSSPEIEEHPPLPSPSELEPKHGPNFDQSIPELASPTLDDADHDHSPGSSPSIAAQARAVSRAASNLSLNTAVSNKDRDRRSPMLHQQEVIGLGIDQNPSRASSKASKRDKDVQEMPPPPLPASKTNGQSRPDPSPVPKAESTASARSSSFKSKRPKYLRSRRDSQRSSVSSVNMDNDSDHDDTSVGPGDMPLPLSRSTSLGSIASGITGLGVYAPPEQKPSTAASLDPLDEETQSRLMSPMADRERPSTPKDRMPPTQPTDTVITAQVKDIRVPPTIARDYQSRLANPAAAPGSPSRKALAAATASTPSANRGREMTLKEQTASIDRLQKENFDLKIKVYYLNEKLEKMSDESVKEALQENIDMKVKLAEFMREKKSMKKQIKELEKELEELGGEVERKKDEEEMAQEEEVWELRQRIETYEIEIEEYRRKEAEREERLREFRRQAETGAQHSEEVEQLRDILSSETARREAVDAENHRLREELYRLHASPTPHLSHTTTTAHSISDRDRSQSRASGDSRAVMNQLNQARRENEDLRREVAAQTSMLTSRNREKDRLYQEIEDLKLRIRGSSAATHHGGLASFNERVESRAHSVLSDRILDRSVSRAGAISATGTALTESERDEYEHEKGQLRDRINSLRLTNSDLQQQLEQAYNDIEGRNQDLEQLESDLAVAQAEVQEMQADRNDALRMREEIEMRYEQLHQEAEEEIEKREEEIEARGQEIMRLEEELRNREDDFHSLQQEMRSVSEVVVRLEDLQEHHQGDVRRLEEKIEDLEHTIRVNEQEMTALEGSLREANEKVERMAVQSESAKNEIAFLREEQDGDKIKIGELESMIKRMEKVLSEEQGRVRDLKDRLQAERREREDLGDSRIDEWEKKVNEKNEEVMKGKEDVRRLRARLGQREEEVREWKGRLEEFEKNLKGALGDLPGAKGGLMKSVINLQKTLDATLSELSATKTSLNDKTRLLSDRENLLEKIGLENRQLTEKLEKERLAHKQSRVTLEALQSTNYTSSRNLANQQTAHKELEKQATRNEREVRKIEAQMKEMVKERNELLIAAFHRLAAICGKDWAQRNSTVTINTGMSAISGSSGQSSSASQRTPSSASGAEKIPIEAAITHPQNVHFPTAARTFLLAVKTLESIFYGFKSRLKALERDLWKEYHTLESSLETKAKRLDRLEGLVRANVQDQSTAKSDIARLKSENRLLKAELNLFKNDSASDLGAKASVPRPGVGRTRTAIEVATDAVESGGLAVTRSDTTRTVPLMHHLSPHGSPPHSNHNSPHNSPNPGAPGASGGGGGSGGGPSSNTSSSATREQDKKWILRLRELEKRLKAEREARLLDRTMAKRNIEEARGEREEIKRELEMEREKLKREREERERIEKLQREQAQGRRK